MSALPGRDPAGTGFRREAPTEQQKAHFDVTQAVARAKSGDQEAVRFLHACYAESVYDYVLSILGDPHKADDATQHVFLRLRSVIHGYEPREAPFSSWLMRIARDMAIHHLRRQDDAASEYEQRNVVALAPPPRRATAQRAAAS